MIICGYNWGRTVKHFDKTLQAYPKRGPFRSFGIRFVSGKHIEVDHPEAVVIRSGAGGYIDSTGVPTLFDHESVSEVRGDSKRPSALVAAASRLRQSATMAA